jgi:hypothetical protein
VYAGSDTTNGRRRVGVASVSGAVSSNVIWVHLPPGGSLDHVMATATAIDGGAPASTSELSPGVAVT